MKQELVGYTTEISENDSVSELYVIADIESGTIKLVPKVYPVFCPVVDDIDTWQENWFKDTGIILEKIDCGNETVITLDIITTLKKNFSTKLNIRNTVIPVKTPIDFKPESVFILVITKEVPGYADVACKLLEIKKGTVTPTNLPIVFSTDYNKSTFTMVEDYLWLHHNIDIIFGHNTFIHVVDEVKNNNLTFECNYKYRPDIIGMGGESVKELIQALKDKLGIKVFINIKGLNKVVLDFTNHYVEWKPYLYDTPESIFDNHCHSIKKMPPTPFRDIRYRHSYIECLTASRAAAKSLHLTSMFDNSK